MKLTGNIMEALAKTQSDFVPPTIGIGARPLWPHTNCTQSTRHQHIILLPPPHNTHHILTTLLRLLLPLPLLLLLSQ